MGRKFYSIYPVLETEMRKRGLHLYNLVPVINRSSNYISIILNGKAEMRASERLLLAEFFKVPADQLFSNEANPATSDAPVAAVAGSGNTLNDLKASNACFAPICTVAAILGFESEKEFFDHMAHLQKPSLAGFPYSFIGQKLWIPRIPFIQFIEGREPK